LIKREPLLRLPPLFGLQLDLSGFQIQQRFSLIDEFWAAKPSSSFVVINLFIKLKGIIEA